MPRAFGLCRVLFALGSLVSDLIIPFKKSPGVGGYFVNQLSGLSVVKYPVHIFIGKPFFCLINLIHTSIFHRLKVGS